MKSVCYMLCSVLLLSACTSSKKTIAVKDALNNLYQKWDLVSLNDEIYNLKSTNNILIEFHEKGQVNGIGGCNRFFGSFTTSGNDLKLGPLGSTKMACEEEVNQWENKFFQTLEKVNGYQFIDNKLVLTSNGQAVAEFEESNVVPDNLAGKWELYYITGPRIIFNALYPEEKPFIQFYQGRPSFHGFTGCNGFSASYNRKPGEKIFNAGPMTLKACPGDGEQFFLKFFNEADRYEVSGDTLTLFNKEVPALKFKKVGR